MCGKRGSQKPPIAIPWEKQPKEKLLKARYRSVRDRVAGEVERQK